METRVTKENAEVLAHIIDALTLTLNDVAVLSKALQAGMAQVVDGSTYAKFPEEIKVSVGGGEFSINEVNHRKLDDVVDEFRNKLVAASTVKKE